MPHIDESKSIAFYNSRPGIRVGGGVLIFNRDGELLLVKPSRNTWSWPGGGWEEGETPRMTAERECKEEIGICPLPLLPAFVNYIPPRSDDSKDVLHFVYTVDPVDENFINSLTLQKDEIEAAKFVPISELDSYMKPYRVVAVRTYLKRRNLGTLLYLEDGN